MRLLKNLTAIFGMLAIIVIAYNYNFAIKPKGKQAGAFITAPVPVKLHRIPEQAEIIFLQDGHYIYTMDRQGGDVTQITFEHPRNYEHVAVSFDRRFIVANEQLPNPTNQPGGNSLVWLFDLEHETEAQLVPNFKTAGNGGVDWDANGFIYFAAQENDVVANPQTPEDHIKNAAASDVYKIRHDGTGLLRLTRTTDGGEADAGVSPDGSLVSYIKEVINFPAENHTEIWVMNPDGANPRMIYKGGLVKQASVHDPEISPDNKQVAFSKVNPDFKNFPDNPSANTAHDLYIINLDGQGLRRVTRPGPISILPNWKDNLILYSEINEGAQYAGISIVSDQGTEQLPERLRSGPWGANWIPQQPTPVKLTIQRDAPGLGIFDPSLEYDEAGVGWMSYSAVTPPTSPDRVSTHLARSDDKGATWKFVAEINTAVNDTITINGAPITGVWQQEVSTLVYDPGDPDPQRRWKLYWHEYFATANDRKFVTHGWIAVRYAPQPQGPWSPRLRLFGSPQIDTTNYPVVMNLSALHSSLNTGLAYSEPGSVVAYGDLYISLLCAQGPPATNKNVLIRSRDHGHTWEFVATLADAADATALGEINFSASDLIRQDDKFYLMLTPLRSRGEPEPSYSGCHFFEFADLASGRLKRDAQGRLVSALYIEGDANRFRGACGYDQQNTGGEILLSELHLEATDRFQIFKTNRQIETDSSDSQSPVVSDAELSKKKVKRKTDPTIIITWVSSDNTAVASHEILFAEDGVTFSTSVIAGLAGNQQSFTWAVPDSLPKTGTGKIKIIARDAQGNVGEAVSGKLKIK
jgi:Tol biopolymer transport system component